VSDRLIQERAAGLQLRAECTKPQTGTSLERREIGERVFALLLVLMAGVIGWIAWSGSVYLLAFSGLFPLLWSKAPSRLVAGMVAFAYYAMAARGLIPGTQVFYGSYGLLVATLLGLLFVGASAVILASAWCLLWKRNANPSAAAWRLPGALILVSVPPIGFLGWANPITSAGVLFPGWGWFGLAAVVIAMCLTIILRRPFRLLALLICGVLPSAFYDGPPAPPWEWKGVDTYFGGVNANTPFLDFYERNRVMISTALAANDSSVLVFPESAAGPWNHTTAQLWQKASRRFGNELTVLFGAEHFKGKDPQRSLIEEVIIAQGSISGILYRQRFPMPISVRRLFSRQEARCHWLDSGVFQLRRHKVAALICYEQVLIWPVLVSMAHRPQVIIAPANAWWSRNTSIPAIQHAILSAWSRLFRIPVVTSFNY
jgi:hypothetical protein